MTNVPEEGYASAECILMPCINGRASSTRYFPKDDLIALAGQIVPEGYTLRELKLTWKEEDDGHRNFGTEIVFGFEGKFYQHDSFRMGPAIKGFLEAQEGTIPAYEVSCREEAEGWDVVWKPRLEAVK